MENTKNSNKTIAKNTMFLYFRMMFTMLVSLYTSRVILQKLGVDDYGIYQAVGGIVGFLSFINGALSTGSSRFLTYALGEGNIEKLKRTFSTTLSVHLLLAIIIVLIAETGGLWFLFNKMVIPDERIDAAVYVYQLSIVTAVFTLTQVPYSASIIAHEKMSVYAYMSIFEVSAKLGICYLLSLGNFDRLKLYATLLLIVQVGLMVYYRLYCIKKFPETKYKFLIDKPLLKEISAFSGWSLFANCSGALNSQGILILLNMFFQPAVVTARAISIQVNMAANQFVNNFRTAANPQIVKRLASGDVTGSHRLLLSSTRYSYYLMLILCLPIYFLAEPLLRVWLGVVPEYTVIFLQLIIIQSLFQVFDTSFYTALYAKGRLKENALISPTLGLLRFPLIYFLFLYGSSPVALSWASLITYAILGVIVKPILIVRIADYTYKDVWSVFKPCLFVSIIAVTLSFIVDNLIDSSTLLFFILEAIALVFCVGLDIFFIGISVNTRKKILYFISNKIRTYCNIIRS